MHKRYAAHLSRQLALVSQTGRWTFTRKAALLDLIAAGKLTESWACETYGLSTEEIASWRARRTRFGSEGLKASKLQEVGR